MIEILSIGDKLSEGTYEVHSRFEGAVNFICKGVLATVANERVGAGPLNIVARGIDLKNLRALDIGFDFIRFDGCEIPIPEDCHFASGIDIEGNIDIIRLLSNLSAFEKSLIVSSSRMSLAFLLDPKRKSAFNSGSEGAFSERMERGMEAVFHDDYIDGVKMIRGLGFGLTPSGDDFISGMLLAYNIAGIVSDRDYSEKIRSIYRAAKGENLVSNTSLLCAKSGWMTERQKALVTAILFGDKSEVTIRTRSLSDIGETSGTDWGVGFLMTLRDILI